MTDPKPAIRHLTRVLGFHLAILAGLYLLWGLLPSGIDTRPDIHDSSGLGAVERGEIVDALRTREAIHGERSHSQIYWSTFWTPWTRSSHRCWVSLKPNGVGFTVVGAMERPMGTVAQEFFVFREGGDWKFDRRGTVISRY